MPAPHGPEIELAAPLGEQRLFAHESIVMSGRVRGPGRITGVRAELDEKPISLELTDVDGDASAFEIHLDCRGLAPGLRRLSITASDAEGRIAKVSGELDIEPYESAAIPGEDQLARLGAGRTVMWCEEPWLDGSAVLALPVRVSGWAWCESGIKEVAVFVDGRLRIRAEHGLPRPHVRGTLGDAVAATGGFAVTLDPAECGPGRHDLTVLARGRDGRASGTRGTIECVTKVPGGDGKPLDDELTADRYVPEAHVGWSFEAEHHARYRWAAFLAPGRRALDAACGSGFGAVILAQSGAASVTAFDVSPVAVENARRRAGDLIELSVEDLQGLPYPDKAFDLITCFEAIEHVQDPGRGMAELSRVLRPGGVLLISTPNRGVYESGNPHHVHEFSSEEFEAALRERFTQVQVQRQQTYAASLIADDETDSVGDSSVSVDAGLRKVAGGRRGEELYMVAAATNGDLPRMPNLAVLGQALELGQRLEDARAWRARALAAESAAASARVAADAARRELIRKGDTGPIGESQRANVATSDSSLPLKKMRARLRGRGTD